jgi:hypothetical protein
MRLMMTMMTMMTMKTMKTMKTGMKIVMRVRQSSAEKK